MGWEVIDMDVEHSRTVAQSALAVVGTVATYLWGGWDAVLMALVVMVVMDYATGITASWVRGRLDSEVGRRGVARKVGIFVVVALANVIDGTGGLGEPILRTVTAWFYIGAEAISVLENLGDIGVPIPARLRQALARLREGEESSDNVDTPSYGGRR